MPEDARERRRKITVILISLFLFGGGGLFLFMMSMGLRDIKGNDPNRLFAYSYEFRDALLPVFKALGFTDGEETAYQGGDKSGIEVVPPEEFDEKFSASAAREENSAGKKKGGKRHSPKSRIPKMPFKGSSLKGGGSGNSKTSGARTSSLGGFSDSLARTAKVERNASAQGNGYSASAKSGAFKRLKTTQKILAQANDTRSAMEARSRWDKGFEGKRKVDGFMRDDKTGVELDDIGSKSLVESLKENKDKTLSAPDVGKPSAAEDPNEEKLSDKMKETLAKSMMDSVMSGIGKGVAAGMTPGNGEKAELPEDVKEYINKIRQDNESVTVTQVSCSNDVTFCQQNGLSGSYYKATYPNEPRWSEVIYKNDEGKLDWLPYPPE